ncbi:alpha-N-arabinofuranosidase [Tessaracoccus sp. MC1627]|uniref:arabinosylfuranosidase ArfA n=1 Tax=Tessaracoccus sp. MC1627 TaxID=2760312 RepID=UPI0016021179|nr:alpha-N-arabinofuranosidase [Tessaracoccus sp. MC1627]MBB1512267.1 alpha-N-arabinofuranosidase [Tessaracoccus sp. MC1627]
MTSHRISVDPDFVVGPVRPRTFGSFVEHLGRCVYTGIYEPGHPTADEQGFRQDVLELVRELGVSTVRYPGGNFVSGYRWEDGVGPVDQRPARLDLAWHSTEPNTFGTDEFMSWCVKADVEPMMAVNLGTRGIQESLDILEYCNVPGGSHFADQRRGNGAEDPYRVKMWCLGNEMDGPWQIGHKTPQEYGRLAAETARAMRMIDPGLELVACGSSNTEMPTFGEWERVVLTETYDVVDMVSAHVYYYEDEGDLGSFLASAVNMDSFIDGVVATADAVRTATKRTKRINISFDEWNVWYQQRVESKVSEGDDWPVAPRLLEDLYNVADAVVVGNLLISLLRHTDRVHSASLAQLVNVIAPIMTEPGGPAWKQTTFHPFALTSRYAKGSVLNVPVRSETYETAKYGEVAQIDAVATHDAEAGEVAVFVVNRGMAGTAPIEVNLKAFGEARLVEAVQLSNPDHTWAASMQDSTSVEPQSIDGAAIVDGILKAELPAVSWAMFRIATA